MDNGTAAGPALRWLRALVLATVALTTAVAFHVAADGLVPGDAGLFALLAVSTVGVAPHLGTQASTRRVVVLLVVWQAFLHLALTAMSGHRGDPAGSAHRDPTTAVRLLPPQPAGGRRTGSYFDQVTPLPQGSGAARHADLTMPHWLQHLVEDLTGPNAAMAVAHLAAAALVGLWLAAGEHALWMVLSLASRPVLQLLGLLLRRLCAAQVISPRRLRLPPGGWPTSGRRTPAWFLVRTIPRRGPPLTA